ncbi:MAG: hypothetical protein CMN77_12495 [Spirochaetaceae bacterium]|nr:hypothetical protein [Spirochaetaceae bacterium]
MKKLRPNWKILFVILFLWIVACVESSEWEGTWVEEDSAGEPVALLYFNPDGSFYASGLTCQYSDDGDGAYILHCNGFKEHCARVARQGDRITLECRSYRGSEPQSSARVIIRRVQETEARRIRSELDP